MSAFIYNIKKHEYRKMEKFELMQWVSPYARFLIHFGTGSVYVKGSVMKTQMRLFHPLGLITFIIVSLILPFSALFTDGSIQEYYRNWYEDFTFWKVKVL